MASHCINKQTDRQTNKGSHTSYSELSLLTCPAAVHLWASSHFPPTPSTPATLAFSLLPEHTTHWGFPLSSLSSPSFLWLAPVIAILVQTLFPCSRLSCTLNHLHPLAVLLPTAIALCGITPLSLVQI